FGAAAGIIKRYGSTCHDEPAWKRGSPKGDRGPSSAGRERLKSRRATACRSMPPSQPKAPASLTCWIVFCAVCNFAGWVLSACHQLNAAGYAVVLVLGLGALWLARPPLLIATPPRVLWRK